MAKAVLTWLDRLDPGVHRRIKGLRLVTAFGIAWMASTAGDRAAGTQRRLSWRHSRGFRPLGQRLQARATPAESSRDLLFLVLAATAEATTTIGLTVMLPATFW